MQTGTLKTESPIRALSWNLEGTRLLTAGSVLQLWHLKSEHADAAEAAKPVSFTVGGEPVSYESDGSQDESDKPQGRVNFCFGLRVFRCLK